MAWQAALSAIGSASSTPSGIFHSAIQNRKARRWAEQQFKYRLVEGPSYQVQGLRKAGLNPLLAATGGGASGAGAGPTAAMIGASPGIDPVGSAQQAGLRSREKKLMDKRLEILQEQLEQEWNKTAASDFMLEQAAADVSLTSARAQLARAGVPRARTQEKFLGDLEKELMGMYERAGGISGMRKSIREPQMRFLDWLTEEYRTGKTPYQQFKKRKERRK